MPQALRKWWIVIAVVLIIAAGIALSMQAVSGRDRQLREQVMIEARLAATGIDPVLAGTLAGTEADIDSANYQELKALMTSIRAAAPHSRFTYLMAERPDGTVIFLVDSESPGTEGYSPPGQEYPEASEVLLNTFTGEENVGGPVTDRWGTWVSGLVPLVYRENETVVAVFGMDIDAADWNSQLVAAALPTLAGMLLVLVLVISFALVQRRNDRERDHLAASAEALRENEERFREIFDKANDGIEIIELLEDGRPGRYLDMNDTACRMVQYSRQELHAMGPAEIDTGMYSRPLEEILRDLHTVGHTTFETGHRRKDGRIVPVDINTHVITLQGKRVLLSLIRDITARKRADEALRESEEKFRAFFTTSRDFVFMTTLDGRLVNFNDAALELLGYGNREELMQVNVHSLYANPGQRERHIGIIRERGYSQDFPVDFVRKDGTIINTLVTSVVREDQDGTVIGFQGTIRDVTAQKRAEEELRELASVVRYAGELIGIATLDGTITFLNDAGARILGIPPDDAIGNNFFQYIPDHLRDKVQTEVIPAMMEHGSWKGDLQYVNQADGTLVEMHALAFSITDPATERPRFIANVSLDITDRKRAEEALKASQVLLSDAMDLAHMAYWEFDVAGGTFTFNDRFYDLYATNAEREGGYRMPADVYARDFVHPDDRHMVADEVSRAIAATDPGYTRQLEHRIIRRDGEVRYIVVRFGITKNQEGRTVKTHGANQDITERKRMEEALRQANRQLNLLSSITRHDIQNQLMVLKGYLDLSHDVLDHPEVLRGYIEKEEMAADTIELQITFTRDYQELGVRAPEWQNVNVLIGKAVKSLPLRDIRVELDPADPDVFADLLLEKVFYNLIDNALRYGGPAMKTIRFSSEEHGTDIVLLCEDDGAGISLEDRSRLFTRGFGKHTGLGLFLSREILSITGITITETGEPGKGARFEILVPKGMWRYTGGGNEQRT